MGSSPAIRSTLLGTVGWGAWLAVGDPGPIESLLGLFATVLAPLLLELSAQHHGATRPGWWLIGGQLLSAFALLLGLSTMPSETALLLATPWALFTVALAFVAAKRWWTRGLRPWTGASIDLGALFVAAGGAAALASTAGLRPLGFSDTIVLLTAIHYHFAGWALPVLGGLAVQRHRPARPWPLWCVAVGVPLVAVGIVASPLAELVGAFVLASGALGVAWAQFASARGLTHGVASILLAVSALALAFAMSMAVSYAVGEFRGLPWPSIGEMVYLHGLINALGFSLLGTWGWVLATRSESTGHTVERSR